jgi:acyl-CoA reductase-like NAD-dependent aldehyde dehydrogenase
MCAVVLRAQVFAPLVAGGFLEFVYGGAEVGHYCNHHALVDSVHLTGSEATYNNIMFGTPKVQVRRGGDVEGGGMLRGPRIQLALL